MFGLLRRSKSQPTESQLKLIVGLGNPGEEYARHRHNVGFMAADAIAQRYGFSPFTTKHRGEIARGKIGNHDVLLLKPMNFMNRSGESVGDAARFYKIPLGNIFVIHDDLDLVIGKVKVKQGGGSGGHNGLKSLDSHLGADYWRLRIGIGHPGHKDAVSDYVLDNFTVEEMALQTLVIDSIADHLSLLLEGNAARFLNEIARETQKE